MEDRAIMTELKRGREFANQLQQLIRNKSDRGVEDEALTTSDAQDLAAKVDGSLRNAIFLLSSQDLPPKSNESHEHFEGRSNTIEDPTRFSRHKRKSLQTWVDYKIGPKEDGYAWRKYGEKFIHNAKRPRCYFRCTYKYDKGCKATKQVQLMQDYPPLYKTTYFGHHTCSKPQMFLDSHHLSRPNTCLISFHDNHSNKTTLDQNNKNNTTLFTNVEEYCKKNRQENIKNDFVPSSLSNDCLLSPNEVLPFEYDDLKWM